MPRVAATGRVNSAQVAQAVSQGGNTSSASQTLKQRLEKALGNEYTVEKNPDGTYTANKKPVTYVKVKDTREKKIRQGLDRITDSYIPETRVYDSTGKQIKHVIRDTYTEKTSSKGYKKTVFERQKTDYSTGQSIAYKTRSVGSSGREVLRKSSQVQEGIRQDFTVYDQGDPRQVQRSPEQRALIRKSGYNAFKTEAYQKTLRPEPQPEQYTAEQFAAEKEAHRTARLDQTFAVQANLQESEKNYTRTSALVGLYKKQKLNLSESKTPFNVTPSSSTSIVTSSNEPQQALNELESRVPVGTKQVETLLPERTSEFIGQPPNTISAAERPGILGKVTAFADKQTFKASQARSQGKAGIGYEATAFLASIPVGVGQFASAVAHPIQTTKSLISAVANPKQTAIAIGAEARNRPATFAGETVGQLGAGYTVGKLIQKGAQTVKAKTVKPKIDKISYEQTYRQIDGEKVTDVTKLQAQVKSGKKVYDVKAYGADVADITAATGRTLKGGQLAEITGKTKTVTRSTKRTGVVRLKDQGVTSIETIGKVYEGDVTNVPEPKTTITRRYAEKIKTQEIYSNTLSGEQRFSVTGRIYDVVTKDGKVELVPSSAYYGFSNKVSDVQVGPTRVQAFETAIRGKGINQEQPFIKINDQYYAVKQSGVAKPYKSINPEKKLTTESEVPSSQVQNLEGVQKAQDSPVTSGALRSFVEEEVRQIEIATPTSIPNQAGVGLVTRVPVEKVAQAKTQESFKPLGASDSQAVNVEPDIISSSVPDYKPAIIDLQAPQAVPQAVPYSVPRSVPQAVPQAVPLAVPQSVPLAVPQAVPQTVPQTIPRTVPQTVPESIPLGVDNPFFTPPALSKEEKALSARYRISVRRGGVFRSIGSAETIEKAFLRGRQRVENTAAASFRVTSLDGGSSGVSGAGRRLLKASSFYESKKESGVFIQRREKRIGSAGEKLEITSKGLFASKIKRSKKGVFG